MVQVIVVRETSWTTSEESRINELDGYRKVTLQNEVLSERSEPRTWE